ncbi:T9SS type A sorting domain-containing protein [Dyadobacter crusticola]|uniref:T9SS type A sorting domain-containing protein n=1 Tax=Dyadobacter crusticola TaxID=292407 RepID=UPI00146FBD21|nr:T9SS type A sorting domain-containing protein [Dyadobacter crusticola]
MTITGSFNNLDPGASYMYEANVSGLPSGAGSISVSWTYVGRNEDVEPTLTTGGAGTNGRTTIKWANTKHTTSSQKSIKATVSWKVGGTTSSKASDPVQIFVNYVGTPASMTVAGTVRSNGQSIDRPCGTTPVTVSVPAVETYMAGLPVTYTYTFPSGWTPGTVTTTATSATSTPSAGGAGTIRVQAKITGQTFQSQIQVTVNRPLPTISAISQSTIKVCSPTESVAITATGTNADKFVWTPTSNVRVNGSSSAQTITGTSANIGGIADGTYTVRAFSTACGVQSTSSVTGTVDKLSPPNRSDLRYDLSATPVDTYTHQVSPYDNHYITFYNTDNTTITWNPIFSSGPAQGSAGVMRFDFILQPYQTLDFSPLVLTNQCGTLSTIASFQGIGPWLMAAYPNPASDVLNLDLATADKTAKLPKEAKLYSEKTGKVVKSVSLSKGAEKNNKVQISVRDLPRGTYYLQIADGADDKAASKTRIVLD